MCCGDAYLDRLQSYTAAWLRGCAVAWMRECMSAWLRGCADAWTLGRMADDISPCARRHMSLQTVCTHGGTFAQIGFTLGSDTGVGLIVGESDGFDVGARLGVRVGLRVGGGVGLCVCGAVRRAGRCAAGTDTS